MTRDKLLNLICDVHPCVDFNLFFNHWLDKYDKHVIEQYKADTNLKDTIREIHDKVAQEMYCKGVDDFVKKIQESNQGHWRATRYEHGEVVSETMSYDIGTVRLIAKQLKAGVKNEN